MQDSALLALVAIATFWSCFAQAMPGGNGTVLDSNTGAPVAGATVNLECRKRLFIHGSETVKNLSTVTDSQGRFSFSPFDVWRCDFAYVRPHKDGLISTGAIDPRYSHTNYETLPTRLYLTPASEERLQRLKYYAAISQGTSPDRKHHYSYIYGDFISARNVAKTDVEIQFVRQAFCARLIEADQRLSEEQREELRKMSGGYPPVPIDHNLHVAPYCP